ncbi:MAG: PilZ domain-containing protein [Deltaproteobacteria bacterium]|nr:PilZ domain-containing protein [Deltaproteobacteria bacterium]
MSEDRKTRRYALRFEVVYDDGEGYMSGPVHDISETGCYIETVMPLAPGKKVLLTPLLEDEAGNFELAGEVVRANEYDLDRIDGETPGMGVRFIDPNPDFVAALLRVHAAEED